MIHEIKFVAGTHIEEAAKMALVIVALQSAPIEFEFNGKRTEVKPGDVVEKILKRYR